MLGHGGGNQKPDCGEEKQPGLKARGDAVEFLNLIPQPAEQEAAPNINNELVTIAPATDAFTNVY